MPFSMHLQCQRGVPRTAAVVLVVTASLALGWLALPTDIVFTTRRGQWEAVSSGLRVSAAAPALRGGERVRFELHAGDRDASLVLQARRRRPGNPVDLLLEREGAALPPVSLGPEAQRLSVPFRPGSTSIALDVEARSGRPDVPAAWLLERFAIERPGGWPATLPRLVPAAVGGAALLLLWGRVRPLVAIALALHAAAATLVPLLRFWDPPSLLARSAGTWWALGLAGAATLTATTLAARLIPDPTRGLRPPGEPRQTLALRFVSLAVAAGFVAVGCVLASPWLLSRLYPDLDLRDPAVAARAFDPGSGTRRSPSLVTPMATTSPCPARPSCPVDVDVLNRGRRSFPRRCPRRRSPRGRVPAPGTDYQGVPQAVRISDSQCLKTRQKPGKTRALRLHTPWTVEASARR